MEQGNVPTELPPWMKFLHSKLINSATPLNIKLFISKLIINTEEVNIPFRYGYYVAPRALFILLSSYGHPLLMDFIIDPYRCFGRMPSTCWGPSCSSSSLETMEGKGSISWWLILWSPYFLGQAWSAPRLLKLMTLYRNPIYLFFFFFLMLCTYISLTI